ncbi:ATP-grasp domain-containing protein [Chthonobacter rhizosphaerae]|uniref:ATP-grasp domain-containing protein n=1 Tax=Chthonobacter rhizosphaerae TaxID=2735553 RepID=UPI0015EF7D9D|nr:ATP-grasp domain-containing protein [Chthonobacter rhizosphaerae]
MTGGADRPVVLIVALSARALAEAAARAGFSPVTVDFFADDDTRAVSLAAHRYPGGWRCGFRRAALLPLLEAATAGLTVAGVVLGAGFEDRPRLIASIAARWPLVGCPPEAVAAAKSPFGLAATCADLGIPHPAVRRDVPAGDDPSRWLVRRRAGSGGAHITAASQPGPIPTGHVAMARVSGRPVSAAVLADGRDAAVVAFTDQWASPAPGAPFRFAGVLGPVGVPPPVDAAVRAAASALAARFGLKGLLSLDLMVDGRSWWLLEINPRPGASLDVLDAPAEPWAEAPAGAASDPAAEGHGAGGSEPRDPPATSLFAAHWTAAGGTIPPVRIADATIRATLVVYAEADYPPVPAASWPAWVLDRPAAGSRPTAGEPLATVAASAATRVSAERLLTRRADALTEILRGIEA